ncbi:SPOR domain-containing protein [bacterium]|nr:SPOR domain-containing protein [bacterium]
MKNCCSIAVVCICTAVICAPGCGNRALLTSPPAQPVSGTVENIDPFILGDEYAKIAQDSFPVSTKNPDEVIKEAITPQKTTADKANESRTADVRRETSEVSKSASDILGYRVQIGMFGDQKEAYAYAEKARAKVDAKVYVIYEAPFFRVRVGDFSEKSEADNYVKILKGLGFNNSWWIRTTINTQ